MITSISTLITLHDYYYITYDNSLIIFYYHAILTYSMSYDYSI